MLSILREKHLYAKLSKCEHWTEEIWFLGHVISAQGIYVDHRRVKEVIEWDHLNTMTKIKNFVGLIGY